MQKNIDLPENFTVFTKNKAYLIRNSTLQKKQTDISLRAIIKIGMNQYMFKKSMFIIVISPETACKMIDNMLYCSILENNI